MTTRTLLAARGKTTTDHDEIRRWADARGGRPMAVTGARGGEPALIRLAFPDAPGPDTEGLASISWDDWFRRFDENGLALLIEEQTSAGRQSLFNKLVRR